MTVLNIAELAQAPITKKHLSHYKPNARFAIMGSRHLADNDPGSRLLCRNSQCLQGTSGAFLFMLYIDVHSQGESQGLLIPQLHSIYGDRFERVP